MNLSWIKKYDLKANKSNYLSQVKFQQSLMEIVTFSLESCLNCSR